MILDCTIIIATKAKEGLYARTEKCSSFSILCLHIFISSFWEKSVEAQFDYFDWQNQESMQRKMSAATSQKMSADFFEKCLTKKARVRGTPKMLRMVLLEKSLRDPLEKSLDGKSRMSSRTEDILEVPFAVECCFAASGRSSGCTGCAPRRFGHQVITSSRNLRRLPWISKNKSLCLIAPRSLCVWRFLPSSAS
jgi:hypothetical protein